MRKHVPKDDLSLSEKIDIYQEEIQNRNYENLERFTLGGMFLTGAISLVALIFISRVYFVAEYCVSFVHLVLCYLFTRFVLKKAIQHTLVVFYIALFPLYAIGILMGTFLIRKAEQSLFWFCSVH